MEIHGTRVPGRFRIMDQNREIGFIDGSAIGSSGFTSPNDAARAAWEAYRGVEIWSGERLMPGHGSSQASIELGASQPALVLGGDRIARIIPPGELPLPLDGWGFSVNLPFEAEVEMKLHNAAVFLRARARRMWRAIRNAGLNSRMRQYGYYHATI